MAIAFVRGKWSVGTSAKTELEITEPTIGYMLAVFVSKTGGTVNTAPVIEDDKDGSTGWTVSSTHGKQNEEAGTTWLAYKITAKGTEKKLKFKPEGGSTGQGIAYAEISGSSGVIDVIQPTNTSGNSKEQTTSPTYPELNSHATNANDIILIGAGIGSSANSGTLEAWTGDGPILTNPETGAARCYYGYAIPGESIFQKSFTTHHELSRPIGLLEVTFEAATNPVAMII